MTSLMASESASCWLITLSAGKAFNAPKPIDGGPDGAACEQWIAWSFRDYPACDAIEIWQRGQKVKTVTRDGRC